MSRAAHCLALAVLVGAGCASLDRAQCVNADWRAIGLEDGPQGRPLERLGDHRRACAEHGVAPQTDAWLAGHAEGLKSFCTSTRGYNAGRAGHAYSGACPEGPMAASFLAGYRKGRELHDLERQLQAVQEQIRRSKALLKEGIRDPRERAREVERLESLTRDSEQLERAFADASARP